MRNDINLIPRSSSIIPAKTMVLIVLISMGSFILMGYCGLFLPLREKNELNNLIKQKNEELLLYSDVEDNYITLLNKIDRLNNINSVFESLKSNNIKMTQVFKDFQKNIPQSIVIQNITCSEGELLLEGLSPTNKEIAQYIVNLRKLDYVLNVVYTSAEYQIPTITENGGSRDEDFMYLFNVTVSLKTNDPPVQESEPQESETTEEKGGE